MIILATSPIHSSPGYHELESIEKEAVLERAAPNNLLLRELFLWESTARKLCASAPANSVPKLGVPIDLGNVCCLVLK